MMTFARARHRLMHLYFRIARPMTLGVRAIVVDDARVLLVRHTYLPGWHLPGGGVEAGETMLQAIEREVLEEGNVRLAGPPALHGLFYNRRASPRDHVAVYVARDFEVLGPYTPNREIAAADFFPLAALPEGATRATRARLAEALGGAPLDPYW
ncbi:MAG: mismatch repair protein MutT [Hyphomicrobiales bacterium]|nr:mismatch repair protein MutT [Hyphomicrobiales bacterium]